MLEYGKYLILTVGGGQRGGAGWSDITTHFEVFPEGSRIEENAGAAAFTSPLVSPEDQFTVVVRPDMYIGCVGQGDSWMDYMRDIFAETST